MMMGDDDVIVRRRQNSSVAVAERAPLVSRVVSRGDTVRRHVVRRTPSLVSSATRRMTIYVNRFRSEQESASHACRHQRHSASSCVHTASARQTDDGQWQRAGRARRGGPRAEPADSRIGARQQPRLVHRSRPLPIHSAMRRARLSSDLRRRSRPTRRQLSACSSL